jgi:UDP-N-acetyl-2-amino-2-deoxyglucuronate dehydrogenase
MLLAQRGVQEDMMRYGLIGSAANVATMHLAALRALPTAQIAAMADLNAARGTPLADEAGCPFYTDYRAMLAEVQPDVAVICVPHPFHAVIARDCLLHGAHVLVEKPLAVEVAEADALIDAAERANRVLAVAFQHRFRPVVERARQFIADGSLGPLVRVLCSEPWFRTAAYYRSAPWRGSWRGEGGGILMNQAPHTLDLLCHLVGLPTRVCGWTRTLAHAIECEDSAQAMFEYPNGAPGYFTTSTLEAGSERRIEVVGDCGALLLTGDQLRLTRFSPSQSEYRATSSELFTQPLVAHEQLALPGDGGGHLAVYQDLEQALTSGRAPRCDGREARMSLELANAITLSSWSEQPVTLPLDRVAYHEFLLERREASVEAPAARR